MSVTAAIERVIEESLFEADIEWINPGDAPGDAECRESLLECSLNQAEVQTWLRRKRASL